MNNKALWIAGGVLLGLAILLTLAVHTKPTPPKEQPAAIEGSLNE